MGNNCIDTDFGLITLNRFKKDVVFLCFMSLLGSSRTLIFFHQPAAYLQRFYIFLNLLHYEA